MRLPKPLALMSRSCNDGSEGFRGGALAARLAVPIHPSTKHLLRLALESASQWAYGRSLRGRVIHVCRQVRQRNSVRSLVASMSSNRVDPHCGQESATDRSMSGPSCLARMRRSTCCRRSALRLSRGLFIGPRMRAAKLMPVSRSRPAAHGVQRPV
jgi:hypothetical protein